MRLEPALVASLTSGGGIALAVLRARLSQAKTKQPLVMKSVEPASALDEHQAELVCWFRGLYGAYPRQFRGYIVQLTPTGLRLRPNWLFKHRMPTFEIPPDVVSVQERPIAAGREARLMLGRAGLYAPGAPLEGAGRVIVSWQTSQGLLEFGVQRCDVPLMRQYIDILRRRALN